MFAEKESGKQESKNKTKPKINRSTDRLQVSLSNSRRFQHSTWRNTVKALLSPRGAYLILDLPEGGA